MQGGTHSLQLHQLKVQIQTSSYLEGCCFEVSFPKTPASLADTSAASLAVKAMKANNFHPKNKCQGIKTKIKSQVL